MPTLTYDHSSKSLSWPGNGKWDALSGPYGKGRLPNGTYKISRREVTAYSSSVPKGFRGPTGKGFFIPIYAQFSTARGASGGRLGIHPDGNKPGTLGCIGLRSDAKRFYDLIAATATSADLKLEVVD